MQNIQQKQMIGTKKMLKLSDLVVIACGTVISSAVFTLAGPVTALTGRGAWIAYLTAVILGFITVLPFYFITKVIRLPGGDYSITTILLGKNAGGLFIWNYILLNMACAISMISIRDYTLAIWTEAPGKLIAFLITFILFLVNISPIKVIIKTQKVMFAIMCIAIAVYILFGMTKIQAGALDIKSSQYFPLGAAGFWSAVTAVVFVCSNYTTIDAMCGMSQNSRRDIPKSMVITFLIIVVLYPLLSFVASNSLPYTDMMGKSIITTSAMLLPKTLFAFFVVFGPFLAVTTTLNAAFTSCPKPLEAAGNDGWFPKIFSYTNRNGQPVFCVLAIFLIIAIPALISDNVVKTANSVTLIQFIIKLIILTAAWLLPTKVPELWNRSTMKKMPVMIYYFIMIICTVVQLALIYLSAKSLTIFQVIVSLLCVILLSMCAFIWIHFNGKNIRVDYKQDDLQ